MKKILLLTTAALITAALLSYTIKSPVFMQPTADCAISCYTTETRDMIQSDANKPGFAVLHPSPLKFKLINPLGVALTFKAADGTEAKGYFIKSAKKSNKWLFVFQEWWGLNDYIRRESDNYYKELGNINVLALDMYDGKVATTPDSAMVYMRNASATRLENIIKGAITYADSNAKIYTIGWCFGGGWSLQATILAGKQAAGCVMYYGKPETNMNRLKTINCDVIGFFGNKDQNFTPQVVTTFEKDMKEAGKNISINRYDAGHGFANPSNPSFDKEATADAHIKAIAFLKAH